MHDSNYNQYSTRSYSTTQVNKPHIPLTDNIATRLWKFRTWYWNYMHHIHAWVRYNFSVYPNTAIYLPCNRTGVTANKNVKEQKWQVCYISAQCSVCINESTRIAKPVSTKVQQYMFPTAAQGQQRHLMSYSRHIGRYFVLPTTYINSFRGMNIT